MILALVTSDPPFERNLTGQNGMRLSLSEILPLSPSG